jgi:hypothetical protein
MQNLILKRAPESYLPGRKVFRGLNLLLEFVLKRVHGKAPGGVRDHKRIGNPLELYQTPLDPI